MANFGYSPQEGVMFYYDNRGKVTDLCINPNVKTVTICSRSSNSFVGSQFSLQDCKKQFPDVEVLRISSDIIDVCINNKMFPNVKNVYSESKYYKRCKNACSQIQKRQLCIKECFVQQLEMLLTLKEFQSSMTTHLMDVWQQILLTLTMSVHVVLMHSPVQLLN